MENDSKQDIFFSNLVKKYILTRLYVSTLYIYIPYKQSLHRVEIPFIHIYIS